MVNSEPTTNLLEIKNKKSVVQKLDKNTVFVQYENNSVIEPSDFDEAFAAIKKLMGTGKIKYLSDLGKFTTVNAEARKYAEQIKLNAIAEAIILHNLAQRLLVRFYLFVRKNEHPTKVFNEYQDALKWLNSL